MVTMIVLLVLQLGVAYGVLSPSQVTSKGGEICYHEASNESVSASLKAASSAALERSPMPTVDYGLVPVKE